MAHYALRMMALLGASGLNRTLTVTETVFMTADCAHPSTPMAKLAHDAIAITTDASPLPTTLSTSTITVSSHSAAATSSAALPVSTSSSSSDTYSSYGDSYEMPLSCLDFSFDINNSTSDSVQFPHLIVPVSKDHPNTSFGSVYVPTINAATAVLYAFDVPTTYTGWDCSVLFGLPAPSQLPNTTSYTESNGPIDISVAVLPDGDNVTWSDTYTEVKDQLAEAEMVARITDYGTTNVTTGACKAGHRVVYAMFVQAPNLYELSYFQDYNTCALGLYLIPL